MPTKRNYLLAATILFACGVTGGVLGVLDSGSFAGAIAQVLGYCGAGYYYSRHRSA